MSKKRQRNSVMVAIGCFAVGAGLAVVCAVVAVLWLAGSALLSGPLARHGGAQMEFDVLFPPGLGETERQAAMEQTLDVVGQRLDDADVRRPEVRLSGDTTLEVELAGEFNQERIVTLLCSPGELEFRAVDGSLTADELDELIRGVRDQQDPTEMVSDTQFEEQLQSHLPDGVEVLWALEWDETAGRKVRTEPYMVALEAALTGRQVARASVKVDQFNLPYVNLVFDDEGKDLFCQFSGDHAGDKLAIVIDDTVLSAPVIQEAICGGRARIALGSGSVPRLEAEAADLAIALNSGALPYPMEMTSVDIVGPAE